MITIITGSRGVGKTTFLLKLIEELKTKGANPSGILTPAIYDEDGNKVGFYALDIRSGEYWEMGRSDKSFDGPGYGPFSFSEQGFAKANEILGNVLTEGFSDVFLDEIGPLELEKGYGFFPVLPLISSFNGNRSLYMVIRPGLIDEFVQKFLGTKKHRIIMVTPENRDDLKLFKK